MERPVQYEYSNEPEDEEDGEDREDGDSEAGGDRSYVNELILQRSRNRHPAFTDDDHQRRTTSTAQTSSE